ncbi:MULTISPECIES: hypothetical protein [unclassified Rummeliibacillus]|uniref:hypothetical protein n=1 Tax=unclassified Rummeliibacillus TaxID=2622809 RepID=UPI00131449D9|nr:MULTISPECIES: hypothetical protein [unclassified Rummeliibacillus]
MDDIKKQKEKKDKKTNNIRDLFEGIRDDILGNVIMNILLFIPKMIWGLVKRIFSN